jgi:Uma2 family endonuclease
MAKTTPPSLPRTWNLSDLIEHVGDVPPKRIRLFPAPGTATEKDVIDLQDREDRLYELVDGILVEKTVGLRESCLAGFLIQWLGSFADLHDSGIVTAPDGMLRLAPGRVRIPDVAFISWKRLPQHQYPNEPIPELVPDLAVEVLSEGNTKAEMDQKLKEYFFAGVLLVWFVDPEKRTVTVYTAPDQSVQLGEDDTLDGGDVLPGFALPLARLFARVARQPRTSPKRQQRKGKGKR